MGSRWPFNRCSPPYPLIRKYSVEVLADINLGAVLHLAETVSYSLELVGLLDQAISLSKLARHYFGAVLNNYRHSNCHQ